MKAFLPESKTSASKLESVRLTDPAAAVPAMAARHTRTDRRILELNKFAEATSGFWGLLEPPGGGGGSLKRLRNKLAENAAVSAADLTKRRSIVNVMARLAVLLVAVGA